MKLRGPGMHMQPHMTVAVPPRFFYGLADAGNLFVVAGWFYETRMNILKLSYLGSCSPLTWPRQSTESSIIITTIFNKFIVATVPSFKEWDKFVKAEKKFGPPPPPAPHQSLGQHECVHGDASLHDDLKSGEGRGSVPLVPLSISITCCI